MVNNQSSLHQFSGFVLFLFSLYQSLLKFCSLLLHTFQFQICYSHFSHLWKCGRTVLTVHHSRHWWCFLLAESIVCVLFCTSQRSDKVLLNNKDYKVGVNCASKTSSTFFNHFGVPRWKVKTLLKFSAHGREVGQLSVHIHVTKQHTFDHSVWSKS